VPGTTTNPRKSSTTDASDNLSQRTLQALLRLVQQQQQELKAEQNAAHSSNTPPSSNNDSNKNNSADKNSNSGNSGNNGNTGGGSAVAVLGTSSTKLVVTVDLSASVQSEASIGEKVQVEMPDGSTQNAKVTAVSPVAQSSSSGDDGSGGSDGGDNGGSGSSPSTVPVTITLNKPAKGGGLDQASVSVDFVQNKAKNVLSVPVTALLATSGSSFAVQEAARPHKLIPVTTGLFAAGYVEISGAGVHPGLQVTDSQG
jgi:hypothetical protein